MQKTETFVMLDHFLPFQPPNNPENQNYKTEKKKKKKTPGDIIILQICMVNDRHMMPFWTVFYSFTLQTTWKIKFLKKWKKHPGDIPILHRCTINDNHICGSWDTECNRQDFFVILDHFCHFTHVYHKWQSHDVWFLRHFKPPNNLQNQNFEKIKTAEDIIILHMFYTWMPIQAVKQMS